MKNINYVTGYLYSSRIKNVQCSTARVSLFVVLPSVFKLYANHCWLDNKVAEGIRGCIKKFPGWLPGARTANGAALCH
jgi:hypothetical protein